MNDTPNHAFGNPKASSLAAKWHALLRRASHPLGGRCQPAVAPLWVSPGRATRAPAATHPYGEAIRAVLSRYVSLLGIPMSFRSAANRYSPPAPRDAVHVHAFGLPTPPVLFGAWPRVSMVALPFAHGVPLREGAHWAMAPGPQLGRGRLLQDEDGHAVGEHVGTNLYSLFDLLGQEALWVPVLLRLHLDLGLPLLLAALAVGGNGRAERLEDGLGCLREETRALLRACHLTRQQNSRAAYIGACRERLTEEIRFLQTEIAFLADGVEEMARRIATDTRRMQEGRRRLDLVQGCRDQPESCGRELEGLQTLPEVREARVQDGRISVTTSPILAEHAGRWYRLGIFRLDLYFNGDIRITNLTDGVGAYDHPSIRQGRPCLGDIREGIAKLLGEFQFVAATEVLIDFLKTVNPAEWRLPVLHWPEVGREASRGVPATT